MRTKAGVGGPLIWWVMPQVTCNGRPIGKGFVAGMALTIAGVALVLIG